jgi:glycosyltransferase involved in cell wall biosynthesis
MTAMRAPESCFVVIVCTRNRPDSLARTLDALQDQTPGGFPVVVVDQSDVSDHALEVRQSVHPGLRVIRDTGRGLSRARNIAWRATGEDWLVFVDDDCLVSPGWAAALEQELAAHPEAEMVSGHVGPRGGLAGEDLRVTVFPVQQAGWRRGRWTRPGALSFGVCFAVQRRAVDRLGGWDERLGPGVTDFPAADDMDFNYRLLRTGGGAWVTPRARAEHDQWRRLEDLPALYRGYVAAWSAFAVKTLRSGDRLGGVWLWLYGVADVLHELKTAVEQRSRLRLRLTGAKLAGLAAGTRRALERTW